MKLIKKKFTIPTKDFDNNMCSLFRVNKFGVHHIITTSIQDTGLGFCDSDQKNKSYSHEFFLKEFGNTIKHFSKSEHKYNWQIEREKEMMNYIKNNLVEYDDLWNTSTNQAKLHIKIINCGYPFIQLSQTAKLVMDGNILWDNSLNNLPTETYYCNDHLSKYPNNLKIQPKLHDLGVFDVPANQHCFLIHKQVRNFLNYGMEFIDATYMNESISDKKQEKKGIKFMPHAPGGINNLGLYESGKEFERIFEPNKTTTLVITVSPGIPIKNTENGVGIGRYPPCTYPYFIYNNEKRYNDFLGKYREDDIISIIHPDSKVPYNELVNKRLWHLECCFGINYDFI